jgi:1-acyl-sn-glycerol-3-phosphate acyltransferase
MSSDDDLKPRLLQLVRGLADELRPAGRFAQSLGLENSLERDYGLDSLSRAELVTRIESELGVTLDVAALAQAETPNDLLRAIRSPAPASTPSPGPDPEPASDDSRIEYPPDSLATLPDVLDWHAERHGERLLVTLESQRGAGTHPAQPTQLSYARLRIDALAVAAGLAGRGCGAGDAVALMLPTGSEFFSAFYGAIYAGCVPVPLYPPARLAQLEDHLQRIAGILHNAEARLLITVPEAKPVAQLLRARCTALRSVATVSELAVAAGPFVRCPIGAASTAFLQYTSGSTGQPKGVVLSHANLLANVRAMWRASQVNSADTFMSWLPLYHDMGLIGACIGSLVVGYRLVLMSPLDFLAKPSRWLWAIHRHRATLSAAPNFAYELCANKIPDSELDGLDLGSWRLAFNGAEPVGAQTIERFAARFARYGFRREAMFTVFGLAEGVLGLTFPPLERGPVVDRIERAALTRDGSAKPARAGDTTALLLVSCGVPLPGHEVRVVDRAAHELAERAQGRVQFRGPSATSGYYKNPAANAALFAGDWLNTGDLGYFAAGELYITGREKDLIVRRGVNIHPAELEAEVANLPGVRRGGVAVFAATDPRSGSERLVVLAETRATDAGERQSITAAITRLAAERIGMPPDDIVLAAPRTVLKTSSGKIRRATSRELYEQGALSSTQRAPWWQLTRLVARAAAAQAGRGVWGVLHIAWGLWAWSALCIAGAGAWLSTMILPGVVSRRRAARAWARGAIAWSGIRVRVEGLERLAGPLTHTSAAVLVANHASYADSILLIAALPPRFAFAVKRELATTALLGAALRRLGAVFVERVDAAGGVEDTGVLEAHARAGEALVIFPEGTFNRAPGLLPFKLGAFVVAAHTGAPIVPVALVGTRSLLRAGEWLPRRGEIAITIGAPIVAIEHDWQAALELRDAARRAILARVAEPDGDLRPHAAGALVG